MAVALRSQPYWTPAGGDPQWTSGGTGESLCAFRPHASRPEAGVRLVNTPITFWHWLTGSRVCGRSRALQHLFGSHGHATRQVLQPLPLQRDRELGRKGTPGTLALDHCPIKAAPFLQVKQGFGTLGTHETLSVCAALLALVDCPGSTRHAQPRLAHDKSRHHRLGDYPPLPRRSTNAPPVLHRCELGGIEVPAVLQAWPDCQLGNRTDRGR